MRFRRIVQAAASDSSTEEEAEVGSGLALLSVFWFRSLVNGPGLAGAVLLSKLLVMNSLSYGLPQKYF